MQQKGPERAVGGQYGAACTVSNELEAVTVVAGRKPVVWSSVEDGTFCRLQVFT